MNKAKDPSLRDDYLNREQLWTLTEARLVIKDYRRLPPQSAYGVLARKLDKPNKTT